MSFLITTRIKPWAIAVATIKISAAFQYQFADIFFEQ
ncbi:hypothetical protein Nos7107_2675 [Nostoc sp. PCC 7107]|nr:hypothetical protein Nos7107_2675 [Nostoc sp. PCC 7107]